MPPTPGFNLEKERIAGEFPAFGQEKGREVIALDCEYVGVRKRGSNKETNALARVSVVHGRGGVLYDTYVKPEEPVLNYRTDISGIRPENLVNAESFEVAQEKVRLMMDGRIVVGHAVFNDLKVLGLRHPKELTRDTATYKKLRSLLGVSPGCCPSLKTVSKLILDIEIQQGEHSSVIDATVALRVYLKLKKQWESEVEKQKKIGKRG